MKSKLKFYLRSKRKFILLYLFFLGIFWLVLYLYDIDRDALDYAVLLTFSLLAGTFTVDFLIQCRHVKKMEESLAALPHELREMPYPKEVTEIDYQNKLKVLFEYKEEQETNTSISRQEMFDYYSLWAHQIKTPLSAMELLLQSYESKVIEEETEAFIKSMKMELFKTEQYVEMVLSYLRIDDMNTDLTLQWYKIDEIIRQAVKKYSQLFIIKKIRLQYQKCEGMVLTDEKWLMLVLEQILSNALKYTRKGVISIYMEPDRENILVIEDTGIGIQSEDLPRIFEKGFTGYNGRKEKKSTGIGLYLCKSVCEKLNHGIYVQSEVGKGTRVSIDLHRKTSRIE
jgi:signal transduction histidine kinase